MSVSSLTFTCKCQRPTPNFCQVKPTLLGQRGWATLCEEHWGQSGFHSLPLSEAQQFHHLVRVVYKTLPASSAGQRCQRGWGSVSRKDDAHETSRQATPPEFRGTPIPARLHRSAKGSSAEKMRVLTTHTGNRVLSGPGNHHPEDGYWRQSPLENRDFRTSLESLYTVPLC